MFDDDFCKRLERILAANDSFVAETRWFDGSVLLESPRGRCWLKVYCGRVIEARTDVPPFGYTFKLTGDQEAWRLLVAGERHFVDLLTGGSRYFLDLVEASNLEPAQIRLEGNCLEAARLYESLFALAESVVETAREVVSGG